MPLHRCGEDSTCRRGGGGGEVNAFEEVHRGRLLGSLTMFDRLIFKGHLTRLHARRALPAFLWSQGTPLTAFAGYVKDCTQALLDHAERLAAQASRPSIYLAGSVTRRRGQTRDEMARAIAERDGITGGLARLDERVELTGVPSDAEGVARLDRSQNAHRHGRLQSWPPYDIQVYVNGREWLARQLDAAGVGYLRADNARLRIDDLEQAWALLRPVRPSGLAEVPQRFGPSGQPPRPGHPRRRLRQLVLGHRPGRDGHRRHVSGPARADRGDARPAAPRHLEPVLDRRAALLGRKFSPSLAAEAMTDAKRRPHGWRVKHRLALNWIKVYDKVSVLRVETTINNPREFRVLRALTDEHGRRSRRWCPMNKGVANMWRYFQVGIGANLRYLDALAAAPLNGKGVAALDALCRSRTRNGRHHARFNPLSPNDLELFRAVLCGAHAIVGFRNHDLTARRYPRPPATQREARRRCARTSRLIAKTRGHGLDAKVPGARLYRITPYGHRILTSVLAIHDHQFPTAFLAPAARAHQPSPASRKSSAEIIDDTRNTARDGDPGALLRPKCMWPPPDNPRPGGASLVSCTSG
jgi:hypothetical protein